MVRRHRVNWGLFSVALILTGVIAWSVLTQVRENHMQDEMLFRLKNRLTRINPEIAHAANSVAWYSASKSYTINKEKVHMCLRDEHGEYYDENMLIYVALHELAHVMNNSIGHTPQFHAKFNELLEEAARQGIYDPRQPIITDYCEYND